MSHLPLIHHWASSRTSEPPLILTHPTSSAIEPIIQSIAAMVVCETPTATGACGTCQACRHVATHSHPDIVVFETDGTTIPIKAIRTILTQLVQTPLHQQRLVALPGIERLSLAAANALLKALEEPAQTTKWLLLTSYPRQVLPTIISRSQVLRMPQDWLRLSIPTSDLLPEDQELVTIFNQLQQRFSTQGPSPELRRSYMRLRDYYMIKSRRGNTKLARDILQLSVPFKL